jgi:hypothetical protein
VSSLRTTVTEVVTGLGMTGVGSLDEALELRPAVMVNVSQGDWGRISEAHAEGLLDDVFVRSWENGRAFFDAADGLRGRHPVRIEWKGDHRPVGYDAIPVDIRIDHVFLVSCKDNSHIVRNAAPASLFEDLLAGGGGGAVDWYEEIGFGALQALWTAVRGEVPGVAHLPLDVSQLSSDQRELVRLSLPGPWPPALLPRYAEFCAVVSEASAHRWASRLTSPAIRETMYWRLIRLASAPYFLLGVVDGAPVRLRVSTPWDWRQHFELLALTVRADPTAGQPVVRWDAEIRERTTHDVRHVIGHVEVRWSKGRFRRPPEAKVYLDTPHTQVAGYFALT